MVLVTITDFLQHVPMYEMARKLAFHGEVVCLAASSWAVLELSPRLHSTCEKPLLDTLQ